MHARSQCKCLNCGEYYIPDARNRRRQKYCRKPECRRESKVQSQRRWRAQPQNVDHDKGPLNVERVREWRAEHPGYWRKHKRKRSHALRDISKLQPTDKEMDTNQDEASALQDILNGQDPLVVGLVVQLAGTALQEDIAGMTHRLISRGRAVMGRHSSGPPYDKTHPSDRTRAASARAF